MNSAVDPATARIVEIGHHHFFKTALPQQTTLLWAYRKPPKRLPPESYENFSLAAWLRLRARIKAGDVDLVIVYTDDWAPWNWRSLRGLFGGKGRRPATPIRLAGVQFARWLGNVPLVAIDYSDSRGTQPHNHFLLDRVSYYFKCQLPYDRWLVFQRSGHPDMPATRFRRQQKNRSRIQRIRPISLGVFDPSVYPPLEAEPVKTVDIFAALSVPNSSAVRVEGFPQLRALAARGISVDIAEQRLPLPEYLERMSRAWLTWSPEGFGWDCHRHYEALLMGTVPVINVPNIVRFKPLVEGVHSLYYYPDEPDGLERAVKAGLADKERLRRIARAGRAHVVQHHIWPDRAPEILRLALGIEPAPGEVILD